MNALKVRNHQTARASMRKIGRPPQADAISFKVLEYPVGT